MATILGRKTVDRVQVLSLDAIPTSGGGTDAPQGSLALVGPVGQVWVKTGPGLSDWDQAGSGSSGGGGNVFIYQPAGTPTGNIYATFSDAYNAAVAFGSSAVIVVDGRFSGGEVLAGSYDFSGIRLEGTLPNAFAFPSSLAIQDGVTFTNLTYIGEGLRIVHQGNTPAIVVPDNDVQPIILGRGTGIEAQNAPFIEVGDNSILFVIGLTGAEILNDGSPVINCSNSFFIGFQGYEGASIGFDSISGTGVGLQFSPISPSARFTDNQPSYTGGYFLDLEADSRFVSYDPSVSGLSSQNVQGAIDELALISAGGSAVVVRPGGPTSPGVYDNWVDAYNAATTTQTPSVIVVDSTFGATLVPAGFYDLSNVTLSGILRNVVSSTSILALEDGVTFEGLQRITNGLTVVNTGSSSPIVYPDFTGPHIFLLDTGSRIASNNAPLISVGDSSSLILLMNFGAGIENFGTEVISGNNSFLNVAMYLQCFVSSDTFVGTGFLNFGYNTPDSFASLSHANWFGAINSGLDSRAELVSYDPSTSGLTSQDVQGAIDELAAVSASPTWENVLAAGNTTGPNLVVIESQITTPSALIPDTAGSNLFITPGSGLVSGAGGGVQIQGGFGGSEGAGGGLQFTGGSGGATDGNGGNVSMQGGFGSGPSASGGQVSLTGGSSNLQPGGMVTLTGGSSFSHDGGGVQIVGGSGNSGGNVGIIGGFGSGSNGGSVGISGATNSNPGGFGGAVTLQPGSADFPGTLILAGGLSTGSNPGGEIWLTAGSGGMSGDGGRVRIDSGNAGLGGGNGGSIEIRAGQSTVQTGGNIEITSGMGDSGGNILIQASNSTNSNGGVVTIVAGTAAIDGDGGPVFITAGSGIGSGTAGQVQITAGNGDTDGAHVLLNAGNGPTLGGDIRLTPGSGGTDGIALVQGNFYTTGENPPRYTVSALVSTDFIADYNQFVRIDPSGPPFTITLPTSAPDRVGLRVTVKNVTANTGTVTIAAAVGDTIDGGPSILMGGAYEVLHFVLSEVGEWSLA